MQSVLRVRVSHRSFKVAMCFPGIPIYVMDQRVILPSMFADRGLSLCFGNDRMQFMTCSNIIYCIAVVSLNDCT